MIGIVDYGLGNLASLANMFDYLDYEAKIVSDLSEIDACAKLVLPGVGSFDAAVRAIAKRAGLREVLEEKARIRKIPFLGVCLGMQLMTSSSEEGDSLGLGWIPGKCVKMKASCDTRVPHMGWNSLTECAESPILAGHVASDKFYFVHSYRVAVENALHSIGKTEHGVTFDSVIQKDNLFGVQFHPEKSHKFGMKILSNFGNL